ncbi:hypothetical protein DY000_02032082 [Brassica cretica]|uniref:Retrotransposon gag domain-containing protein n=1 Tax=Brassica cretica TaxID=69181 RepID=A0ABQ7E0S3_BRACR|nr:hypothetical protein DY000_02032082 [Brassica cretica]
MTPTSRATGFGTLDENGTLRDEEGRTHNSAGQLINAQGDEIPEVIDVAEMNDFHLSREWYDWVGQDPFQGLPHQDPINHIEELEDLMSRSEQNEVFEYHMLCKIFPYSISGDAFSWFSQLQPGSLTSWEYIERAFLYKFLDETEATREKDKNNKWYRLVESWQIKRKDLIPRQLVDYIMAEGDEHHVSGELSRVEEAGTEVTTSMSTGDTTSTSTDGTTSTSTDGMTSTTTNSRTSMSTDGTTSMSTDGTTSTSTDGKTSTSTDARTSTSTNVTTSTSIVSTTSTSTNVTTSTLIDSTTSTSTNGTTSESITQTIQASIDGDPCFRTRPPI